MTVEPSATVDGRWYVWATTPTSAIAQVADKYKLVRALLNATPTGLARVGGYSAAGSEMDGYKEKIGDTMRRYAVDERKGK